MVKCLKIKKNYGQKAISLVKEKNWLNSSKILGKTGTYILIPLNNNARKKDLEKLGGEIVDRELKDVKRPYPSDLKEELKEIIPQEKLSKVNKSYDLIGDIAILEIPKELEKLEKSIAWTLYRKHKNIRSVAKKTSKFSGKFRIRNIKTLCGEKRTSTIYKEAGVKLKLDINKTYFSPRLSAERIRIANLVNPNEKVLVMFSGIAPYPLIIEKTQPKVNKIYGIEINPDAYKYSLENIRLNKSKKVVSILGDAKEVVKNFETKFDRIIMILPKKSYEFLEEAFKVSKKGTIIHIYSFYDEKDIPKKVKKDISKLTKDFSKVKINNVEKCGSYSPGKFRVCADVTLLGSR